MTPPDIAAIFAVVLVVGVAGFIALSSYNAVVALRQRSDKAWSNIDVVLKQRHDQLPNLVGAVRGVADGQRVARSGSRRAGSPRRPCVEFAAREEGFAAWQAIAGGRYAPPHGGGDAWLNERRPPRAGRRCKAAY